MDTKKIKQIIELFEDSKVASMDLEIDDIKIKLEKFNAAPINTLTQVASIPVSEPVLANEVAKEIEPVKDYVKSPLVGTYYASPSQSSKPFVEVGSKVNENDIVCIIEAMKVMNEIRAHKAGTITEIKVSDGDMVQFDEELIAIGE
ncbi:MAG: acetyl-CoA carboxylase biotin carboxyl carrier protein [Bacilli bacterium]|nr:acetyl-CoA carboxylase biotin carboxyl carrier protein [Bacilli bacterium]